MNAILYLRHATAVLTMLIICSLFFVISCNEKQQRKKSYQQPNILWIYLEDTAPLMGCYGTSMVKTPNIDSLAQIGTLYSNAYMPAPVCSASRSSIITGVMASTFGAHNHHSSRTKESSIHLPDGLKTIPELFKEAGYFTFNNGKDDYNFTYDRRDLYSQDYRLHSLYGKSGIRLDLDSLKDKQPFFGQVQLYGGKEIFNSRFKDNVKTPVDRSKVELPPYLPNHPVIVEEYANHMDAIQVTDNRVGEIIRKLRKNGVLENTIVFFFSDHGMRITRNKQFLYDGGLHVPLIIADFTKKKKNILSGAINNDLVSGLDLGTTSLVLANISIPAYMEGKNILDSTDKKREYVISIRDRCDFTIDRIRSVRSTDFKYIRNFMTDRPYTQPTYMDVDNVEFVKVMRQMHKDGMLNSVQDRFMSKERPPEELYDINKDPFELNNLADDQEYSDVLKEYADVLNKWMVETDDKGQYPESEEGLMLMLGIWGKHCVNPEYDPIRKKHPDLEGSLLYLKSKTPIVVDSSIREVPVLELKKALMETD